jgi:hypothetical protein
MKKLLIILALTSAVFAGRWFYVTQPDGTVISCYDDEQGSVVCY